MLKPYYKQTQSINIEPPRSYYVPFGESDKESYDREDSSRFMSLNGTWKITAYDRVLDVPDDFYNTDGEKDIPVPSCVQYFGYDFFQYTNTRFPFPFDPPHIPSKNPTYKYSRYFEHKKTDEKTYIIFEGVDSAFYLYVNGKEVGYSQISHRISEFDITEYVKDGENKLDVLVRNAVIKNTGKTTIMLKKAFSFRLELANGNYRCLQLGGTWAQECTPRVTEFAHGVTKVHSLRGCGFHNTNPFMGALRDNCTEESGECYGVQLIYSGSFAITGEWYKHNTLCLQGGIADVGFGWEIQGGQSFTTPQVALCYSNNGIGGMSRSYHDFLRERVINPSYVKALRPIVINNWEATYFDFDNDKLCAIIDEAAKLGIDTFVLDDGWFGARNSDWAGLGDWVVNEEKLKGGLKTVIDRCKSHGMKFGIWFEPEMVNEDSDLYRAHSDWAIHKNGVEPVRIRQQLVLDFTRKEVVDYIFDAVSKVLASNEISYVKWDMNRTITECYSESLPPHRQGEFMHRYILGVYDLAERLMKKFPKVFFEGCAGGGGRFDAGMLYYFPQIWTSDCTDGYERTKIQYGTSICYPVSAMSCHVSACPNHQTGRTVPFKTRGDIASLGATGYELNLTKLSDEEKAQAKRQIQDYKKIFELVLNGDLYRLSSPFDSNYFCEMLVSKDKSGGYIVGERVPTYPHGWVTNHYLYIDGLDENKMYEIVELGVEASGASLKYAGILLPKVNDFESFAWHIKERSN